MGSQKRGLWKKVGISIGFFAFIVASFAIDGFLRFLSEILIIEILAKWLLHLRETVY